MKPSPSFSTDVDAFVGLNPQLFALHDFGPDFEQGFLRGLPEMKLADQRQFDRRGHDQLAARIFVHAAAERFLLDRAVGEVQRFGGERGGHAGRARADDQHVQSLARGALVLLVDRLDGLHALNQRIAYQSHATQFARR